MSATMTKEEKDMEKYVKEHERQKKAAGVTDKRKQGRKPGVTKGSPKVALGTKPKSPYALRTMRVNEEGKYGLDIKKDYDSLDEVLKVVEKEVEDGQGNGLHEIVIVVR